MTKEIKKVRILEESLIDKNSVISRSIGILIFLLSSILGLFISRKRLQSLINKNSIIDIQNTNLLRKIVNDNKVEVYKLDDKMVNAFTLKGPKLIYTTNFVKVLKLSQDELMAIILHEYGHYKEGHTKIGKDFEFFGSIFLISGTIFLLTIFLPSSIGSYLDMISSLFGMIIVERSRRYMEINSDLYISKYGYNKHGISAFKKLLKYQKIKFCKFIKEPEKCDIYLKKLHRWDSHPDTEKRIKDLIEKTKILKLIKVKNFDLLRIILDKLKNFISRNKEV